MAPKAWRKRALRAVSLFATTLVLGSAFAAPAAPALLAPAEAPALHDALASRTALQALALDLAGAPGLAGALAIVGPGAPPAPGQVGIEEAFAALYAAEGRAMPAGFAPPPGPVASALAPVVLAAAQAAILTEQALAALGPEERAFLLEHLVPAALPAPPGAPQAEEDAQVAALAALVDMPRLQLGAAMLAQALDQFPGFAVQEPAFMMSWVDPLGMVEVGSTGTDTYYADRVLIVDLGGDDTYKNRAGAVGPNWPFQVRVSAVLDVGGDDAYLEAPLVEYGTSRGLVRAGVTQAAAIMGVGLLVDRWGNDQYVAAINPGVLYNNNASVCFTAVVAQGAALLGAAALADLGGNDAYTAQARELIDDPGNLCHFNFVLAFAQGLGAVNGAGLLADYTGNDAYAVLTEAAGHYDNIAHTYGQGAAIGGAGLLVDQEGDDDYRADAYSRFGKLAYVVKGNYAYVFAQGSAAASNLASAVQECAPTLGLSPVLQGVLRCPTPSLGLLVDVLGDDAFGATPRATDSGYGCTYAIWAVGSAQGSSAWAGLGALVNLDVTGRDRFSIAPVADSVNCYAYGVRAMSYGQGYGGSILWNIWDAPLAVVVPALPDTSAIVAVGALASGGLQDEDHCPVPRLGLASTPHLQACEDLVDQPTPHLGSAQDSYLSVPRATNRPSPGYPVFAESWVQGSAGRAPMLTGGPVNGIGLNLDAGGDDTYDSIANAYGHQPSALSVAQGATVGSIAVHADLGGHDRYVARAYANGVDNPLRTLAQGLASGNNLLTASTPPFCVPGSVCVSSVTVTVLSMQGIHVDVGGWDFYSEYYDPGSGLCPRDGTTGAMQRWGTAPGGCTTTVPASTGFALGLDGMSEL